MSIFFKSYSHLLYSTGNSAQYSVILRNGKRTWKIIDICICITESLTCTPEVEWSESHLVVSDSLRPPGLYSPWDSPGQNTGVDGCSLLRGIFPTQGMNPGLPHGRYSLPAEPPGKSALPFKDSSDGFRLTKENLFFLKLPLGPSAGSHLKRRNYIKMYSRR